LASLIAKSSEINKNVNKVGESKRVESSEVQDQLEVLAKQLDEAKNESEIREIEAKIQ